MRYGIYVLCDGGAGGAPRLVAQIDGRIITITRREKAVAFIISAERMAALAETLEIMADPAAMRAIRRARGGKEKFYPLTALNES